MAFEIGDELFLDDNSDTQMLLDLDGEIGLPRYEAEDSAYRSAVNDVHMMGEDAKDSQNKAGNSMAEDAELDDEDEGDNADGDM